VDEPTGRDRARRDDRARGPRAARARVVAALLLLGAFACASPTPSERAESRCLPAFADAGGWLGADAAWSIARPEGDEARRSTLWLFGDTFVGRPDAPDRVGARFIHNSIGWSRCTTAGRFEIDYAWGRDDAGQATAALPPSERADFVWPFGGFFDEGSLYLIAVEVEAVAPSGPLALPFRLIGSELLRIREPARAPERWSVERRRLTSDRLGFPGAALIVQDGWLYLFAFRQDAPDRVPRFLTRLPLDAARAFEAGLADAIETLDESGRWIRGFHPDRARLLMDDSATEMSVGWHPEAGLYRAVYSHPVVPEGDPTPPGALKVRTAPHLEGPWSAPVVVHEPVELDGRTPGVACYAGKAHPRFARAHEIVLTYVCNVAPLPGENGLARFGRLLRSMEIYRPRTVVVPSRPEAAGTPQRPRRSPAP